jgi:hypothetical protein
VFHLAPLLPVHWLVLASFGPLLLLAEEGRKSLARWRQLRAARGSAHHHCAT